MFITRVSMFMTLQTRKMHENILEKISKYDINYF